MTMAQLTEVLKANRDYSFRTDKISYQSIDTKSGKQFYVTGYISVPEIDLYNDLVTENGLKSMLDQINKSTITLDYEHEAWRDDSTILPVGKIIEAKIDDRGLWVKAQLNKNSPKFKSLWGSIRDGFVGAFSIAFKPLKTTMKAVGESQVRLIEDLKLLNVALTGTPVNTGAVMTDYGFKSIMLKAINDMTVIEGEQIEECVLVPKSLIQKQIMEEPKMAEQIEEKSVDLTSKTDVPAMESAVAKPAVVEAKAVEVSEIEQKSQQKIAELEAELKAMAEKQKEILAKAEESAKELKALKEQPVLKAHNASPEFKGFSDNRSILGMIR